MDYNKQLYQALKTIHETNTKLSEQLMQVTNNPTQIIELNKKIAQTKEIAEAFEKYAKLIDDWKQVTEMIDQETNKELLQMAQLEYQELKNTITQLENELRILLIPKDPNEGKDIIIEMRPAAGGDESCIFVSDLFDNYKRYAAANQWKLQVLDLTTNAIGISNLSFSLSGSDVYSKMKFESGVHRVQRVPETEAKGRVHTSTITVSVLPEQDEVEVKINPTDLRIDVYRAGGAGGQHVNKTESAVRITHLPTNTVATCQEGKSQISNREKAMKVLRAKLWEKAVNEQNKEVGDLVRAQVGTGDRSEKIRTYNYPQNRVTDHRINLTINRLDTIMLGDLTLIHETLMNDEKAKKLAALALNND